MPGPVFLEGDGVTFHPIETDDVAFVQRGWNDPRVRRTVDRQRPQDADGLESWLADIRDDGLLHFLVCADGDHFLVYADGEPVGWAGLVSLRPTHGRAEVGDWIAPEHQGNGDATAAAELLADFAIDEHRCQKVTARVFEGNEGSRRVLETAGFAEEARLADEYYVDGEYLDVHW